MSYEVVDNKGRGRPIATSQGIEELENHAGPALARFLELGEADAALVEEIKKEVKYEQRTAYIAALFVGEPPFVLSNGIEDEL